MKISRTLATGAARGPLRLWAAAVQWAGGAAAGQPRKEDRSEAPSAAACDAVDGAACAGAGTLRDIREEAMAAPLPRILILRGLAVAPRIAAGRGSSCFPLLRFGPCRSGGGLPALLTWLAPLSLWVPALMGFCRRCRRLRESDHGQRGLLQEPARAGPGRQTPLRASTPRHVAGVARTPAWGSLEARQPVQRSSTSTAESSSAPLVSLRHAGAHSLYRNRNRTACFQVAASLPWAYRLRMAKVRPFRIGTLAGALGYTQKIPQEYSGDRWAPRRSLAGASRETFVRVFSKRTRVKLRKAPCGEEFVSTAPLQPRLPFCQVALQCSVRGSPGSTSPAFTSRGAWRGERTEAMGTHSSNHLQSSIPTPLSRTGRFLSHPH